MEGMLFGWIIFCVVVGVIGTDRTVGFWGAFLWSFFLSPIIGLIITLVSKTNAEVAREQATWKEQELQRKSLHQIQKNTSPAVSVADELRKLKQLLDEGVLSEAEYESQKSKLLTK